MRTSIFLSEFISECHSLHQIQITLHFLARVHLRICVFFSEPIRYHLLFSVRFYIRSFYFLSDFNSEATRFYNILHQNHLPSVKFYSRSSKFLSDFYTRNCKFLSDFTSETPSLFQILPQNLLASLRFYLRTSKFSSDFTSDLRHTSESLSFRQILPQNLVISVIFYLRCYLRTC